MTVHTRSRRRHERAAQDAALLEAAAHARAPDVRAALARGADVNAVDAATGHTAVTCAIAGDSNWEDVDVSDASFRLQSRLDVLRALLTSENASLYALNAPARGVTPLGLAAWLNVPDAVRVLLEESRGLVAVDGTDSLGVTPLMYTARDGAVEAASHLLAHGARPDLRDAHHRTAVHHALRHPKLLWLCEASLRKQRLREYLSGNKRQLHPLPHPHAAYAQSFAFSSPDLSHWPPPSEVVLSRSTAMLIRAVVTGDLPAVHQILFPPSHRTPVLVNRLDSQGWSPLHYCVCAANPSVEILDALFLAGADMSLYTSSDHGTPLHCLARKAQEPMSPLQATQQRNFVVHLVRELRAPLAAADEEDETCLHVAAEHGQSADVMLALLACDSRKTVREARNARGLTPLDVARPELCMAFGPDAEPARSSSVASFRTIRPSSASSTSTSSYASLMTIPSRPAPSALVRTGAFSPPPGADMDMDADVDAAQLARRIVENLTMVCQESTAAAPSSALELAGLHELLDEAARLGALWAYAMQARIHEAARDLRDARARFTAVDRLLQTATVELEDALGTRFSDPRDSTDRARRRTTDSGDSDATAVSAQGSLGRKWRSMSDLRASSESARRASSELQLPYLAAVEECGPVAAPAPEKPTASFLNALLSPTAPKELAHKASKQSIDSGRTASPGHFKKDVFSASGTAKIKAWFRKKLRFELPDVASDVRIVLPGEQSPRASPFSPAREKHQQKSSSNGLIPVARQVIQTASKDLCCIEGSMDDAEQFLALATNLLSQTERRLRAIIASRRATLESSRLAQLEDHLDDPFMSAIASTIRAAHGDAAATTTTTPVPFPITRPRAGSDSDNSLLSSPPISAGSSMVSLADTLIEAEDDDVRTVRRLLTRRVEARTDGAFDEVDKAMTWLRIVQDALRTLRRDVHASTSPALSAL